MATSGDTTFTDTVSEIINDAFIACGVNPDQQTISNNDYQYAFRTLNRMILSWQTDDLHLWLRTEATLFLQQNQYIYRFQTATVGDHCTNSYVETTLGILAPLGSSTIQLASSTGMNVNDNIGIVLDSGATFWTTIASITVLGLVIVIGLAATLPSQSSANNYVHTYTTKITRPLRISQARRYSYNGGNEICIGGDNGAMMAREDYFALPTKASQGTAVQWFYDPQEVAGSLYVWPNPSDSTYAIKFTYIRQIQDFVNPTDTADFPTEWLNALVLGLSIALMPAYGQTAKAQQLKQDFAMAYNKLLQWDTEHSTVLLGPASY